MSCVYKEHSFDHFDCTDSTTSTLSTTYSSSGQPLSLLDAKRSSALKIPSYALYTDPRNSDMTSTSSLQTSPESAQPDQSSVRRRRPLKPTGTSTRRCSSTPTWREKMTAKFRNNLAATSLPENYFRQCEVAEGRYRIIKAAAQIHC